MQAPPNVPANLSPEEGRSLIRLARLTIAEHLKYPVAEEERQAVQAGLKRSAFDRHCGTFVTLKKGGQLRGCIGSLVADTPLRESVRQNALHAAFHDPRFPPLAREEFERIAIEVSVLSPPAPLPYADGDDLLARLRPGADGVVIRKGHASATFLPQVWQQLPRRQDFLSHLCLKAGLGAQEWQSGDLTVETYEVHYFEENRRGEGKASGS